MDLKDRKDFTTENLKDVENLLIAGYKPINVYYYKRNQKIRFVFSADHGCLECYLKIKSIRQNSNK